MPISLQKGQKVDLTKGNPSLKHVLVGLGWDVNRYDGGFAFDLDASAFLLGANGQTPNTDAFIFYGNLKHPSGEDFSIETAIVVGEIYRHGGGWKFNAVGSGFQGGLAALCANYGIETC